MKKVILLAGILATLSLTQSFAQDQPRQGGGRRDTTMRGGGQGGRGGMMRDMTQVEQKDLPQAIQDYLKKEYASAEFRRAGKSTEGQYMVVMTQGEKREILTFDAQGVFVSKREMQGRPGGNPGGGGPRN